VPQSSPEDRRLPGANDDDTVAPPTVSRTLDTPVGGPTSTGAELPGWGDPAGRRDATHPWTAVFSRRRRRHASTRRRRGWMELP